MTVAPAAANRGASSRDDVAPAENRAMSSPDGSAVGRVLDGDLPSPHGSVVPADRAEAKKRSSSTGKPRSASRRRMTPPT